MMTAVLVTGCGVSGAGSCTEQYIGKQYRYWAGGSKKDRIRERVYRSLIQQE